MTAPPLAQTAPYHQLTIDVPEADAQFIAGALESFGAPAPQSVTARRMGKSVPWRVEAIFDVAPDRAALATFLATVLIDDTQPAHAARIFFNLQPLAEEDWVALSQSQLPPIRTRRFYVRGSHVPLPADLGTRHVLTIEAGMAFGTGHHASTHACLLALEALSTRSPLPLREGARGRGRAANSDSAFAGRPPTLALPRKGGGERTGVALGHSACSTSAPERASSRSRRRSCGHRRARSRATSIPSPSKLRGRIAG